MSAVTISVEVNDSLTLDDALVLSIQSLDSRQLVLCVSGPGNEILLRACLETGNQVSVTEKLEVTFLGTAVNPQRRNPDHARICFSDIQSTVIRRQSFAGKSIANPPRLGA